MPPERSAYRFERFVFDPASGELSDVETRAVVARLQPQVASLLTALLERPGTVVARAELQSRLWPDTTVDFDDGLNFCVRQLRLALGDEAAAPRFIETLARRGYRFIPAVTRVPEVPSSPPSSGPRQVRRRTLMTLGAALAIVGAVLVIGQVTRASQPAHTGAALAVLPFRVDASDSTMVAYQRQLLDQVNAGVRGPSWDLVTDTSAATHVLSGALRRRGFSVEVFVQLVRRPGRRHLWADSILDSYAFSGNSTLTADRIARSVDRLLRADTTTVRRP